MDIFNQSKLNRIELNNGMVSDLNNMKRVISLHPEEQLVDVNIISKQFDYNDIWSPLFIKNKHCIKANKASLIKIINALIQETEENIKIDVKQLSENIDKE